MRARTANEMLRAFAHVRRFGHLVWLPIYAHHGTNDHLASIQVRCLSHGLAARLIRALYLLEVLYSGQQIVHGPAGIYQHAVGTSVVAGDLCREAHTHEILCTLQCASSACRLWLDHGAD